MSLERVITCNVCKETCPPNLWKYHKCESKGSIMTAGEAVAPSWEHWKQTDSYANLYYSIFSWCKSYYGPEGTVAAERTEELIHSVFLQGYLYGTRGM
jgi:hypothetical protein